MRLATSEAMLFKYGSGTGTDLSTLRSAREKLSGGGIPSGPLSFMRVYDQIAAVVKSGGKTRRAAKMQSLKDWHPDILEFIQAKAKEEKKARTLIESGEYDANFNGEAYSSIMFQNANLSVRVSDDFMQAAVDDRKWRHALGHRPQSRRPGARRQVSLPADCRGDVGLRRSRPSIRNDDQPLAHVPGDRADQRFEPVLRVHVPRRHGLQPGEPEPEEVPGAGRPLQRRPFRKAAAIFITAQEILVDHASYPTPRSRKTATSTARWGSAMPTWAACSCRWPFPTTATQAAESPARSRPS